MDATAAQVLGYRAEDLLGAPISTVLPYLDLPVPAGERTGAGSRTTIAVRRDGSGIEVRAHQLAVTSASAPGTVTWLIGPGLEDPAGTAGGAEGLLPAIIRSSSDAIISTDRAARVTSWNPAAERMYGYTGEEILGRPASVLLPTVSGQEAGEIIARVIDGERVDQLRRELRRRDGRVITVAITASPLTDQTGDIVGMLTVCRDITERERAESRLRALLEATPDAVLGVNRDGRIVLINLMAEHMFGYRRSELLGQDIEVLVPGRLAAAHAVLRHGYVSDPRPRPMGAGRPLQAVRRDGTVFPVEISLNSLGSGDELIVTAAVRDITERLAAQAEQQRLREEAERQAMQVRLQRGQRMESLGQLAGGIAHDFNNMLAAVLSFAQFIAEDARSGDAEALPGIARDADQIVRAINRGTSLTRQLLAFARQDVVRPRVLAINDVLLGVEEMLRRSIGEHIGLMLHLGEPPPVLADPGQVEQVVINLAVNARDAMPRGGKLTIDTSLVVVDSAYVTRGTPLRPGPYARLRVTDTGTGIPPDVIERVFEPFFTTKPPGQGTGLGLAMVYGIASQAGGGVSIYSEPDMGTTISILLPATDQDVLPEPEQPHIADLASAGETVLVIEDDQTLREVTERVLCGGGYHVLMAENPSAALALAAEYPFSVDAVLSDVIMPDMPDVPLSTLLATTQPDARMMYMSGYATPTFGAHGTLSPDVILLEKPFTKVELLTAVRHTLTGGRPLRQWDAGNTLPPDPSPRY